MRLTDLERFMSKVSPEPNTGCWLWMAGVDKDGYGKFATGPNGGQTHYRAHKWIIGAPKGALVMHSCDVPCCVNPAHLRVATQKENREDCVRKGRTAKGLKHPGWRGDRERAAELRRSGMKVEQVMAELGCSRSFVYCACRPGKGST
jgi:hypothetical protein